MKIKYGIPTTGDSFIKSRIKIYPTSYPTIFQACIFLIHHKNKLGQEEVFNVIEKSSKPISRAEIMEILKERGEKISRNISRLLQFGEIKFIEIDRNKAKEMFKDKAPTRRMRLYYCKHVKKILNVFVI